MFSLMPPHTAALGQKPKAPEPPESMRGKARLSPRLGLGRFVPQCHSPGQPPIVQPPAQRVQLSSAQLIQPQGGVFGDVWGQGKPWRAAGHGVGSGCSLTVATSCHHCHWEDVTDTCWNWQCPPRASLSTTALASGGTSPTKIPMEPFPNTLWDLSAAQPCSSLGSKHKTSQGLVAFTSSAGSFCVGQGSGWQQGAPFQLGQPFSLRKHRKHSPGSPLPSTALRPVLSSSGSEEQTRAHSTLCRQEAREKNRYVLLGTGQAGAAPALQHPVATPARCHLRGTRPPRRFLGASWRGLHQPESVASRSGL